MEDLDLHACHICGAIAVVQNSEFSGLGGVASDCRPWPTACDIGVCKSCGTVQKLINTFWRDEAAKIYADYHLYHQSSNGNEQPIFDQVSGLASPRSKKVLEFAINAAKLPNSGRMMDVGCGSGAMLRAFSNALPGWELNGYEPNLTQPEKVKAIPGLKNIFSCGLSDTPRTFDLISVIHALEHIEDPIAFLRIVRNKLSPNGTVLIEVPYFPDNPFDLLITDHCTHFTMPTLLYTLKSAGLEPISMRTDVVDKEISVVAKIDHQSSTTLIDPNVVIENVVLLNNCISWIKSVLEDAKTISTKGKFGLFGTSISANWMLGQLNNSIAFFVEEDMTRVDKLYRNRPVYLPTKTPINSNVYITLPRLLAEKINNRLNISSSHYHLPPCM